MGIESMVLRAIMFVASVAYQQAQTAKMKRKMKEQQDKMKGSEFTKRGEAAPIPVVYGRQRMGGIQVTEKVKNNYTAASETGDKVFENSFGSGSQSGSKNEFLTAQYVIAQEGINQVKHLKVDGQDYDRKPYDIKEEAEFQHRIRCFYDGGTADPVATANGLRSTNYFTGCSYATAHFKLNRDNPQYNGIPEMGFLIEGQKVRSVIRSGTLPNYTYALDTSYSYSNNPAYCLLDYLLSSSYGRGLTASQIDLESFYNAAQVCDTTVMTGAQVSGKMFSQPRVTKVGTYSELPSTLKEETYPNDLWFTEDTSKYYTWVKPASTWVFQETTFGFTRNIPLYECNIELDVSRPIRDNILALLSTMGMAELTYTTGGKYKLSLEYPTSQAEVDALIPAALQFGEDEIIRESVSINFPNAQERLNQCTVRFYNEHNDFKEDTVTWPTAGSTVYNTYLSEDNGIQHHSEETGVGITDPYHALAKAEQLVRKSRTVHTISFTLNKAGLVLEPGDFIKLTLGDMGLNDEVYRVEAIKVNENFTVDVTAYFFDYQSLAWNISDDQAYIIPPTYVHSLTAPSNVTFTAGTSTISGFSTGKVTWTAAGDINVKDYVVYISSDGGTTYNELGTTVNTFLDVGNIKAGSYLFGVKSRSNTGRTSGMSVSSSNSVAATNAAYASLTIFKRSASAPTTPTGGVYNWATGTITTVPTGWSTTVTTGADPLYVSTLNITTNDPADTADALSGWATPAVLAQNGADGAPGVDGIDGVDGANGLDGADGSDGNTVALLTVYKRSATAPSTPTGGSFNFTSVVLTAPSGWSSTVPAGTDPLYSSNSVASIVGTSGTDTTLTWSSPVVMAQNGVNGTNGVDGVDGVDGVTGKSVYTGVIYIRASSTPAAPTGGSFNFGTNTLTPPSGWSLSVPSGSNPVYATRYVFSITGDTGSVTAGTWVTPFKVAENGQDGLDGSDGLSTYTAFIYRRATSTPSTPTGGSYDFGTNTLTPPTGWFRTIPSGTDPVYTTSALASVVGTIGTDTTLTWFTPYELVRNGINGVDGVDGVDGSDGVSGNTVAQLQIFKRSSTAPSTPSGGSFNFDTLTLTAPTGWSSTAPTGTDPLYTSSAIASIVGTSGTDSSITWSSPTVLARNGDDGVDGAPGADGADGADGSNGKSVYTAVIFKRSSTAPSAPTGGSFNFGTNTLTPPSGWSLSVPTGTDPVYATRYVFSIIGDTGSQTAVTWATPFKLAENGVDGADGADGLDGSDGRSTFLASVFKRSSTTPSTPSGGSYNFGTNTLTPPSGWSSSVPVGTDPLHISTTLASVVGTTGIDSTLTWTSPAILAQNGTNGANGTDGVDGARGAGWFRYVDSTNASSYYATDTQTRVNAAFATATSLTPTTGDKFIIKCTDTAIAYSYASSTWSTQADFIDGNLMVAGTITSNELATGSVTADKINVSSLDAISATIGTFQSAISGARLVIQDDKILVYDSSNVLRVKIGNLA